MNEVDELTLVARLRQDVQAGAELSGAERRLAHEISAASAHSGTAGGRSREPAAHGRGRTSRIRRPLIVVGTAAAVLAAALVISQKVSDHAPPAASGTRPSVRSSLAPPISGQAARTEAELVDYATRAAAAAPAFSPGPHEWVYADIDQARSSAGTGGFLFGPPNERVTVPTWTRVDLGEVATVTHGRVVFTPMFPGSLAGWPSISYRYLDALPTNPAKLEAVIAANVRRLGPSGPPEVGIFSAIDFLMASQLRAVLPPRLYAGLYGVLARLPQVRFDSTTDLAGRHGIGLSIVEDGYIREEIVINPRTYAYMGDLYVATKSHTDVALDGTRHIAKGQVLGWSALLRSGIVARAGQVPQRAGG